MHAINKFGFTLKGEGKRKVYDDADSQYEDPISDRNSPESIDVFEEGRLRQAKHLMLLTGRTEEGLCQ